MSNLEANLNTNLNTGLNTVLNSEVDVNALADQRILKQISYVVLTMMGVAVAIAVTASNVA